MCVRMLIAIVVLLLSGCAYSDLESRIAKLEKSKAKDYMQLAAETGARKFWWRNSLTGAADSLDQLLCTNLTNGDMALVGYQSGETGQFYVYHYYASGTHSTDSPIRISCSGASGGAWYLCNIYVQSIVGNAADGTRYLDMSNTATLDAGSRADGRCWYAKDNNRIECYDGTNVQYWTATGNE